MTSFSEAVYAIVRQIPAGKVATYQDIARLLGNPKAARVVGAAIAHNPDSATIPCHRVVGSDGTLHGYAFGDGLPAKQALLQQEGVTFTGKKVDLPTFRWYHTKYV